MIIERTEHEGWLSNAYLIADGPGGHGVLVDANGVAAPLVAAADAQGVTITHVLLTHHHADHVDGVDAYRARYGVPVVAHAECAAQLPDLAVDRLVGNGDTIASGGLAIVVLDTPGHCRGHVAYLVGGHCLTADVLFHGTVGGTRAPGGHYGELVDTIMGRLMALSPETVVLPGHREPTTIGDEWEHNPFIRLWRGLDPEAAEPVTVRDTPATLRLWAPDYDGGHKALVEFADGSRAIVGGSQVSR